MLNVKELREKCDHTHRLVKSSDNTILHIRHWKSNNDNKKNIAILIFHGITAHSEPYSFIGGPLAQSGYDVFGMDLRGHGLSDGIRGDYPNEGTLLDDLNSVVLDIKKDFPKLIVLGHSLGVLTSMFLMETALSSIDGLVLLSAARKVRPGAYPPVPTLTKLKYLLNHLLRPSKPIINYYREGMLGLDDPLFNFKYTLRFLKVFNLKKVNLPEKMNFPVLVAVGDQDELFSIEDVKDLYDELPSQKKEFIVLKGAKHAEFKLEHVDLFKDWLDRNFK